MAEPARTREEIQGIVLQLLDAYPNYQDWTVDDFRQFSELELGYFRTLIGLKDDVTAYIPRSFFEQYGSGAYVQFARALNRESREQGLPELFTENVLKVRVGERLGLDNDARAALDTETPMSLNVFGRSVLANAVEVAQAAMRQEMTTLPAGGGIELDYQIPLQTMQALAANNPGVIPEELVRTDGVGLGIYLSDEAAYDSGYSSFGTLNSAFPGLGSNVLEAVPPTVPDADLSGVARDIFDPAKRDVPLYLAWAIGYQQAEIDAVNNFAANDDLINNRQITPNVTENTRQRAQ